MTETIPPVNDWHRLLQHIGPGHHEILKQTLPTPSLKLLLGAQIDDCKARLAELDLSRDAVEFKERYRSIKLQQELAETLLEFVNSLTI